jgi:hypothetical protein
MRNTKQGDGPLVAGRLTFAPARPIYGADLRDRATRRFLAGLSSGIIIFNLRCLQVRVEGGKPLHDDSCPLGTRRQAHKDIDT